MKKLSLFSLLAILIAPSVANASDVLVQTQETLIPYTQPARAGYRPASRVDYDASIPANDGECYILCGGDAKPVFPPKETTRPSYRPPVAGEYNTPPANNSGVTLGEVFTGSIDLEDEPVRPTYRPAPMGEYATPPTAASNPVTLWEVFTGGSIRGEGRPSTRPSYRPAPWDREDILQSDGEFDDVACILLAV